MLKIVVSIMQSAIREHFESLQAAASQQLGWPEWSDASGLGGDPEKLIEFLKDYFKQGVGRRAVLVCDWMVSNDCGASDNRLATRCQSEFATEAFGTLAIMSRPRRMADIDRTIGRDSTATELQDKLKLIVDRLDYLAAPAGAAPMSICTVAVRPLRTNETEFREYFRLRRRVYTAMGYLDEEVENTRSGLEINEADVHAIHLGAFCSDGIRQRLAGTARVVTMDGADSALQRLFEGMTSIDPVAISRLDSPYMLGLPIFQSHSALNPVIGDIFVRNEPCGELSRVIVAPEFRGLGISSRLIDEAVRRSRDRGVQRLFLECLAIHERLYERHGFKRIRGVEGQVVEVGRTMIAMEQRLDASAAILPALGQGAAAGA